LQARIERDNISDGTKNGYKVFDFGFWRLK